MHADISSAFHVQQVLMVKEVVCGAFDHATKGHFESYRDEFAFRWNNRAVKDSERMKDAICKIDGKRTDEGYFENATSAEEKTKE